MEFENNGGRVKYKKEVAEGAHKSVESGNLSGGFPKVKKTFEDQHSLYGYLGFVGDESSHIYHLSKICTTCSKDELGSNVSDSAAVTKTTFHWAKGGADSGPKSFGDGCENFDWWTNLYGTDWNIGEKIKTLGDGGWSKEQDT